MAEFGIKATDLADPQGAGSTPIRGVERPASSFTIPSGILDIGVQAVRDYQKDQVAEMKARAAKAGNNLLADYARSQTAIADSNLPLEEKNARMNALDSKFMLTATEMGLQEDFKKTRDLLKTGGVTGEIVTAEKARREELQRKTTFLQGKGLYVPSGASEDYVEGLMQNFAHTQQIITDYDRSQKILEDAQKNNKYSQEQADRIKKEKSTEALNKIGGNALNSFTMQAKSISDQVLAGTLTEEQARASLIQLQAQYAGPITNLSTDNPQQANAWKSVFEDITKANLDIITNRGESGNRDIQRITNNASLMAAQNNPDLLQLAALRPWLGDNALTSQLATEQIAARIIPSLVGTNYSDSGVSNSIVASKSNKSSEVMTYSWVRSGLSNIMTNKTPDPEAEQGYFQATNNLLTDLGHQNPGNLSASDLKDVAGFMLSPEFAYVVKKGGLNPSAASEASRVFQQVYGNTIDTEIKNALLAPIPQGTASGPGGTSSVGVSSGNYLDVLNIEYKDGRVQFIPKSLPDQPGSKNLIISQSIARNLKPQEKALNQSLKLAAHLEGTTDYAKYWEEHKSELMPYVFADPNKVAKPVVINGVEWQYIGPPGGNTRDKNNWKQISNGSRTE